MICTAFSTSAALLAAGLPLSMKRVSSISTLIGAIPGALPPLIGWTAVTGQADPGGLTLFLVLFLWQIPHSLAIGRMYRDDYARAGIRLLPVIDPDGPSTGRQIVANSASATGTPEMSVGMIVTSMPR